MTAYLTLAEFKDRTLMPSEFVDAIETARAGWTLLQLEQQSRWIDSQLRKRYAAPFASDVPEAVKAWLARLVTVRCFLRRGVDPTDQQFEEIRRDADNAAAEIKEAADSSDKLWDLPLRDSEKTSGITLGGPRVYSEQSPYVWADGQLDTGRLEDSSRRGT